MGEREPRCVEERTFEPILDRPDVVGDPAMNAAVSRVTDDRMMDGAQVNADLMRAAGRDRDVYQRHTFELFRLRDAGHRAARASGASRHFLPIAGIAADGGIHPAALQNPAPDQRDLLDFAVVELSRQFLMRGVVFGGHHHS